MRAPDLSADLYREITRFAGGTPGWVRSAADVGTNAGLLLFAVLFAAAWWRARGRDAPVMAAALAAPLAMTAAYLVSEVAKSHLKEERPCRAVAGAAHIAACPPPGDWSFPSNHAAIAAGSAAALVVAWRAMAPLVLPLAAVMAFSRVFVGVHYPHDVAAGFLVGVTVAASVSLLLIRPAAPLVHAARSVPAGALLLGPPPAHSPDTPPAAPHAPAPAIAGGRPLRPATRPRTADPALAPGPDEAAVTMPDVLGGVPARRP